MSPKSLPTTEAPTTMRAALLLMAKAITFLATACPPDLPACPPASEKRPRRRPSRA